MTRSSTPRVALVTCDHLLAQGFEGDRPLARACEALEMEVICVSWSDPDVDWESFDLTVLRSTWDYTLRRSEFLQWIMSVPRLHNPAQVVLENSDKVYLRALTEAGLPVVPTIYAAPGDAVELPDLGEFVIKPSVGAGSRGAGRFDTDVADDLQRAREHASALHAEGRTLLIQPYVNGIDSAGETAMVFIDGKLSHSIRKGRMLPKNSGFDVLGPAVFVPGNISAGRITQEETDTATQILRSLSEGLEEPLLYARIDLVPSDSGPVLIEAELIEPNLYFEFSDGAPLLFAHAIRSRIERGRS